MTRANASGVRYGPPDTGKGARGQRGRHCSEAGCVTVLSTYNKETTCWLHSVPVHRHPLETR
jgi:hypothetical protein